MSSKPGSITLGLMRYVLTSLSLFFILSISAQKYNFTNYNVEQGLSQSQVQDIIQDREGFLWIATLGGICRFDGTTFHNYSKADGLSSLLDYDIHPDNDGRLWVGSQDGIQSFNGINFEKYSSPEGLKINTVNNIRENNTGQVFFCAKNKLFGINDKKKVFQVNEFSDYYTTAVSVDKDKNMYAAVYKRGIYQFTNGEWKQWLNFTSTDSNIIIYSLYFTTGNTYLLSNKGLYTITDGIVKLILPREKSKPEFICIQEDNRGRIWIGTTRGAYLLYKDGTVEYVGVAAGLSDNSIIKIVKDREGNLWFATDGNGIYKLTDSPLIYFNSSHGLKGNVVMSITKDMGNNIWIGTLEGGLQKYDGNKFISVMIPSAKAEAQKINALLFDSHGQLWVGTLGGGLWIRYNGKFHEVVTNNNVHFKEVVSIYEDSQQTIWVCTSSGVYYYSEVTMRKIAGIDQPCFSVFEQGKDSMLTGTTFGLWRIVHKSAVSKVEIDGQKTGTVNCILKWRDYFLLGTEDEGIILWNPKANKTRYCSSADGLPSDFIFSLLPTDDNNFFAGTGHGISNISITGNSFSVKNYSFFNNPYGPECNLNAAQKMDDGKICFGTTRGLVVYNPADAILKATAPLIYLSGVSLFSKNINSTIAKDSTRSWNNIPVNLILSHDQNHLTFEFTGLYFTNPPDIKYRYKLEGLDSSYGELATVPKVIYSNLPPGKYHFKAYAQSGEGLQSSNSIDFPFEIKAPFYQATWFRVLTVLTLICIGILIQYGRMQFKTKRNSIIKSIRIEEQKKIQERTSEDLHDDLGNKITRISVLADVLQNKLANGDAGKEKLIAEIKENAQSLYLGTKDIIWSLSPDNDNLFDLLDRCQSFGMSLFDETDIEFQTSLLKESYREIKIPLAINRNLVLIIKEALNNILKHSAASSAGIHIKLSAENDLDILIYDNGKGIPNKNPDAGNGLPNMKKRIARIGGEVQIYPNKPIGTVVQVKLKVPRQEG